MLDAIALFCLLNAGTISMLVWHFASRLIDD